MIGKTVAHYRIVEKLGEGGGGVVYKAEDLTLPRHVALKFLSPSFCRETDTVSRFLHEARAISKLNHPNIETIYSLEEIDEQKFIALEYLAGGTLADKLRSGPLAMARALEYAIEIAQGLSHAHDHGIIHRDLKTSNIMLSAEGIVKITDFGLAKLSGGSRLTRTGYTIGTAAYMSPEQARGEEVDLRTDIFSFGIVLYELITGGLPFKGIHEAALLYEIVNEQPKSLREVRPDAPDIAERIVGRALEKDPGKRYQSVTDLLTELRGALKEVETGSSAGRRFRLPRLGRKWLWAGLTFCIVLAFVVLFRSIQVSVLQGDVPSLAILYLKNLGPASDEAYAYGIVQDMIVDNAKAGVVRVSPMKDILSLQGERLPIDQIAQRLNVRYVLDGTLKREGDLFQLSAQIVEAENGVTIWADRIQATTREASTIQGRLTQSILTVLNLKPSATVARGITSPKTENPEAYEYYLRANYLYKTKRSRGDVEIAQGLFEKAVGLDSTFISSWVGLGLIFESLGRYDRADSIYSTGLRIAREEGDSLSVAECSVRLGVVRIYTSDFARAEEYLTLGLNIYERLGDLSGESTTLTNLGALSSARNDNERALDFYTRSLKKVRSIDDRLEESRLLGNVGVTYQDKGDYDFALDAFSGALAIKQKIEDRRGEAVMLENLGNLHLELGNYTAAESLFVRALPIHREIGNRLFEGSVLCSFSELSEARRDSGKAAAYYEQSLAIHREIRNRWWIGTVLTKLGSFYRETKTTTAAAAMLTEAVRIFGELEDKPHRLQSMSELALAEIIVDRRREGEKLLADVAEGYLVLMKSAASIQVAWNLYKGYTRLGNQAEGADHLRAAYDQIHDRAGRIANTSVRERYLTMVHRNREIVRAWENLPGGLR